MLSLKPEPMDASAEWRKAKKSASGANCTILDELADGLVAVGDTKNPNDIRCLFTGDLKVFLEDYQVGIYKPATNPIKVELMGRGFAMSTKWWTSPLWYTSQELDAFLDGVMQGEFDHFVDTPTEFTSYEEAMVPFIAKVKKGEYDGKKEFVHLEPLFEQIKNGEYDHLVSC
jgi:hypothetical protein